MGTGQVDRPEVRGFAVGKALTVLIAFCFLLPPGVWAQAKDVQRVLILTQRDPLVSPTTRAVGEEIVGQLRKSNPQIEIQSQALGPVVVSDGALHLELRYWWLRKNQNAKPDVIVAMGTTPLVFLIEWDKEFFPDTPVIYLGALKELLGDRKPSSRFTGVWGRVEPAKTLDAALRLLPETRHVVVVGGNGLYDRHVVALAKEQFRRYEPRLEFTYLTDLDMPTLLDKVRNLPAHSIIYHAPITVDATGTLFIDTVQSLPMLVSAAKVPIFGVYDLEMGKGTVGGRVDSYALQGRIAGEMAARILNGERPQDVLPVTPDNIYMFDLRAMKRWGLSEANLPPGSVLINHEPSLWEAYKWYFIGGILLLFLQALLILGLLWERKRRRAIEQNLREGLAFEALRSQISASFINLPEDQMASLIERNLGRVSEFLRMERGTLYDLSIGGAIVKRVFSWGQNGFPLPPETFDLSLSSWFGGRVMRGEVLVTPDTALLPDAASEEREMLLERGYRSAVSAPLAAGGKVIGFLSFVSTNRQSGWTENQEMQARVLAEIFSNALRRFRMQTALRESEERFRLMANTAPVMIWMAGTDKLCTYFNAAWLNFTGRPLESEVGNGWLGGVHPEDMATCMETYVQAFERRENFSIEYRLRRFDGEYRWVMDTGVPRLDETGNFGGFIGSAFDVTERKAATETLAGVSRRLIEAQEKERRYVARELHDDLGQRMALLAIDLQKHEEALPESSPALKSQTSQMNQHIQEISSEIQTLSHRLHSSKLELLGVVAAVRSFCNELAAQKKVQIHFGHSDVPTQLPPEIALCLFRVAQEALQNAVKHSGEQELHVELRGVPDAILLSVRDAGVGFDINEAMHHHGIGLISMRERVQLVEGTISIESKPAVGTEISVRIPMAVNPAEPQPKK